VKIPEAGNIIFPESEADYGFIYFGIYLSCCVQNLIKQYYIHTLFLNVFAIMIKL